MYFPKNQWQLTFKALRCWGIIERQTNQQQKAKLEKQMYNTLTVRPNIVKPLLAIGGELKEPLFCSSYLQLERKEALRGTEIIYRQQATACRN